MINLLLCTFPVNQSLQPITGVWLAAQGGRRMREGEREGERERKKGHISNLSQIGHSKLGLSRPYVQLYQFLFPNLGEHSAVKVEVMIRVKTMLRCDWCNFFACIPCGPILRQTWSTCEGSSDDKKYNRRLLPTCPLGHSRSASQRLGARQGLSLCIDSFGCYSVTEAALLALHVPSHLRGVAMK